MEEIIKAIKKDFYKYRNGIIAQNLRAIFLPDVLIYGLTIPDLKIIANQYDKNHELGMELWKDKTNRESRLLAMYLIPISEITISQAKEMIEDVRSWEEAEMLPFIILRKLDFAQEILAMMNSQIDLSQFSQYCLKMLAKNIENKDY